MYRLPSEFLRTPPSPRTPSVTRRPDHPRRMELHHLHVYQFGAHVVCQDHTVPRALPRVRGDLVDPTPAAGRHNDRLGLEVDELARLAGIREGTYHPPILLEELSDSRLHVDLRLGGENLLLEGPDHLQSRPVSNVAEPPVRVRSEGTL